MIAGTGGAGEADELQLGAALGGLLLEGEDPSTTYADDARHWVAIYSELVAFKKRLRDRVRQAMREIPPEARAAVEKDLALIEVQLARIEDRLAFWYRRHWDLIGLDIDQDSRDVVHYGRRVSLTKRELQLLLFLARHPNRHFSVDALISEAWHDSRLVPEQLRLYVARLRRKLGEIEAPCRLENRPGKGYGLFFD
jgi:DNA-binding response OmpR family regulator